MNRQLHNFLMKLSNSTVEKLEQHNTGLLFPTNQFILTQDVHLILESLNNLEWIQSNDRFRMFCETMAEKLGHKSNSVQTRLTRQLCNISQSELLYAVEFKLNLTFDNFNCKLEKRRGWEKYGSWRAQRRGQGMEEEQECQSQIQILRKRFNLLQNNFKQHLRRCQYLQFNQYNQPQITSYGKSEHNSESEADRDSESESESVFNSESEQEERERVYEI